MWSSDDTNKSITVKIDQFHVFTKGILYAKYQAFREHFQNFRHQNIHRNFKNRTFG